MYTEYTRTCTCSCISIPYRYKGTLFSYVVHNSCSRCRTAFAPFWHLVAYIKTYYYSCNGGMRPREGSMDPSKHGLVASQAAHMNVAVADPQWQCLVLI